MKPITNVNAFKMWSSIAAEIGLADFDMWDGPYGVIPMKDMQRCLF